MENGGYVFILGEEDYGEIPNVTFLPNSFAGLKLDGTSASIHSGTTADNTMVGADGLLCVYSGGFANDVAVKPDGKLWIYSGGLANGISVGAGGELRVGYGGWITGRMTFEAGATVAPATEAILDFDLRQTAPGEAALVNNLSFIPNTFLFTITVNGAQPSGTYKLAGGAAAFDQTVSVINTSGRTLGTLSVGGSLSTAYADYSLKKNGTELTLVVAKSTIPPNGPLEPYNNDFVYRNKTVNTNVTDSYGIHLSGPEDEIFIDRIGSVVGHSNRVGKDDKIDYGKIVLEHGAKLSFHVEATAAAKFTVYKLIEKSGKYTIKKLQTLTLKDKDRDGIYTADSKKAAELNGSGDYYVSMQYADRRKTFDEAFYCVTLNGVDKGTRFFTKGSNSDDWTDLKAAGPGGAVGNVGKIKKGTDKVVSDGWVGFGDAVDYAKFTLDSAAELSFLINASEGVKFSILSLNSKIKKTGEVFSVKSLQTTGVKAGRPQETKLLKLKTGTYYLKVQSSAPRKGDGADYSINLLSSGRFFSDGDNGWNSYVYDRKKTPDEKKENTEVTKSAGTTITGSTEILFDKAGNVKESTCHNFVGFGDETDYTKVVLEMDATLTFLINKTEGAVKFTVNQLLDNKKFVTKQTTTIKTAETERETKALRLSAGTYYLGMQATKPRKDDSVYYDVLVKDFVFESSAETSLSMPEPELGAASADDLAFPSGLAETSLADTESGLAVLPDVGLEWKSMLA